MLFIGEPVIDVSCPVSVKTIRTNYRVSIRNSPFPVGNHLSGDIMEMKSRRMFLASCLGVVGATVAALVTFPLFRFLAPRKESGGVAKVSIPAAEVPEGGAKFFEFEGRSAVIVRKKGGGFVALSAVCTHLGCIVQWQKNQEQFLCPCHAGLYSIDGTVVSGPPPKPLVKLSFTVTEGNIIVG